MIAHVPAMADPGTADPGTAELQLGIAMSGPGTAELQLGSCPLPQTTVRSDIFVRVMMGNTWSIEKITI